MHETRRTALSWAFLGVAFVVVVSLIVVMNTTLGSGADDPAVAPATAADVAPPDSGALVGVSVDGAQESLADYADRLGKTPAVMVTFAELPFAENDLTTVDGAVMQAREAGSSVLLTLEPLDGLDAVDDAVIDDLVTRLRAWNDSGVPVFVRFAHEMNGSWYAWGQQPEEYVATFRRVADAVHAGAPASAMMWAPSYAGGYPFDGGEWSARGADRRLLDTDDDGRLTERDDGYAPYWPGDDAVDWVGMSLYHWGQVYPWGENERPSAGKLVDQLRGDYAVPGTQEQVVPDFYAEYAVRHGKPVSITETAALYVPGGPGPSERAVKEAWWSQVWDPELVEDLPAIKMVNWFEWDKDEPETGGRIDWTVTRDADLAAAYADALPSWARFAD
ncbi:glycoside hydrolase family 26 protein [Nocardioides sp. AX2bis]|uniref:glycoside hydrolase family 26 protein n=1 Tax=Nocardioides sp. AX2bis TaxID=2653157 RepID=UPI0012EF969D|nr:glycosyl hydrolase [Nocardioides sp. AX2bis]VXB68562.1 Glycosyl hydrolase family 26 [Nocardioides sp. AX2bis]